MKSRLLLHICCIGCGAYVARLLGEEFAVSLFFANPNIYPPEEYGRRFEETGRVAKEYGLALKQAPDDHGAWLEMVKGHEQDSEGGERCALCYASRLRATAEEAKREGFTHFASTLSVSPHKKAEVLNRIGAELGREFELTFIGRDFKKQDGFKKACTLSRELGLYRQDYCGCEFTLRQGLNNP